MGVVIAFAVALAVIALAWRGFGISNPEDRRHGDDDLRGRAGLSRPQRPAPPRVIAPDDDPEFLSEIDRRLRGEDKSN